MARFCRYELRTTDVDAGRAFYPEVMGTGFWDEGVSVVPLPERAAAMGATAHWLGHVGVADVEAAARRMVSLGGQQLGPHHPGSTGTQALLRDPFGARLAVSPEVPAPGRTVVAWHLLHASDEARASALYADLFGWVATEAADMGENGHHQMFAWEAAGPSVGSMGNTARPPQIHPQWQFFFAVPDIEDAAARVRALGGLVLPVVQTSTGDLAAACDDPQGAAFGLYQIVKA